MPVVLGATLEAIDEVEVPDIDVDDVVKVFTVGLAAVEVLASLEAILDEVEINVVEVFTVELAAVVVLAVLEATDEVGVDVIGVVAVELAAVVVLAVLEVIDEVWVDVVDVVAVELTAVEVLASLEAILDEVGGVHVNMVLELKIFSKYKFRVGLKNLGCLRGGGIILGRSSRNREYRKE